MALSEGAGSASAFETGADERIAIVGCGKMGEAILAGWLASNEGQASCLGGGNFTIVQPNDGRRARQMSEHGVCGVASVAQLAGVCAGAACETCATGADCAASAASGASADAGAAEPADGSRKAFDIVVLAVKPQVMPGVLEDVAALADAGAVHGSTLFITIAAGIHTSAYEKALSGAIDNVRVVRVMPNMPLQVGMGASAVAGGANSTEADVERVRALFSALGEAVVVTEDQIDAVCAISGGGPAYFAYMVEALGAAGRSLGLDGQLAERLALATLGGTYHAIVESGVSPAEMRQSVCSPGGTTLAALASMDERGFTPMVEDAMRAAVERAQQLRKEG